MQIYIIKSNGKKGGHDFQAENGKVLESIWREEREWGNEVFILQSQKIKQIIKKFYELAHEKVKE